MESLGTVSRRMGVPGACSLLLPSDVKRLASVAEPIKDIHDFMSKVNQNCLVAVKVEAAKSVAKALKPLLPALSTIEM